MTFYSLHAKNIISPLLHMRTCDILSKCDTMILTPLHYSFVYHTHFLQFVVTFAQFWMEITLMYTKYLHPVENITNNFVRWVLRTYQLISSL